LRLEERDRFTALASPCPTRDHLTQLAASPPGRGARAQALQEIAALQPDVVARVDDEHVRPLDDGIIHFPLQERVWSPRH